MEENKNFSLGGFPPIYEVVTTIKKKEFTPTSILSIQSILAKKSMNLKENNNSYVMSTVNKVNRSK